MQGFNPLPPTYPQRNVERNTSGFRVTKFQKSLLSLNSRKCMGPDGIAGWVLTENADILARPKSNTLNQSYSEARLPQSWKCANIVPICEPRKNLSMP